MSANPFKQIGGITSAANVPKADLISWALARVMQVMADASEVNNTDLSGQLLIQIKTTGNKFALDSTDHTTADDGVSVLVDSAGNRFKIIGSGDAIGPSSAVDGEITLFNGVTGKLLKRATAFTGILKAAAGVLAAAVAGTDYMHPGTTSTLTKGFALTPNNAGTKSSGTFTPDPTLGNYQFYTNGGAHTLAAPASDCAIDILITNSGTAGAVTLSGFTVGASTGASLDTTNAHKFIISIRRINSVATYSIYALQ